MTREPDSRKRRWWRRGSAVLAATAVGAAALSPVVVRDGRDEGGCRPDISEFRHKGRSSQVYTYSCGEVADQDGSGPPKGVLVHLHGDGAGEFDLDGGGDDGGEPTLTEIAQVAASRDMVLIAPRTPDHRRGETWWRKLDRNLRWLNALVDDRVHGENGLDPGNVWWSGYSGGAEMLSYGVLRSARELVSGGAVLMAGGGAPEETPDPDAEPLTVPLRWYVGDLDDGTRSADGFDALSAAAGGSAWHQAAGAEGVGLHILPGVAHLDFPQAEVLDRVLPPSAPDRDGKRRG
ncbi:hypothetical protein BJF89_02755 [Corynebacterium sp. CNJ-954]|uniref:alpha/beta hydrolase n=1 Tax=Corynebacterium sp. CNJ-954 TaxID=1904962 RepID=UPI0009671BC8|nr:hypothetical protein [Corynebacterium sp. CNJ-954]OLT53744.1 hypothetical protein BJF89_02755 [Corynebacterium sp. CNJ-954]